MDRGKLQGVWVPRRDLTNWRVTIGDTPYTKDNPGPVASCRVQLDSIGCLTSGSIALKKPGVIPRPFEQRVFIEIYSRVEGWIPVCLACLPPANPDAPQEWTLSLQPGEVRDMDGYFDGSLVGYVAGVDGVEANHWTETNRTVVDRVLKANPSASIGRDWKGEVILATPESGSPVMVSRAHFYDWKMQPEVVLPYATESRWDGGKGWAKGEYLGTLHSAQTPQKGDGTGIKTPSIPRPPCTPRKAVDAGQVEFKDSIGPVGPPLLYQREAIENLVETDKEGVQTTTEFVLRDARLALSRPDTRKITATQYAHVSVYDLQKWFENSALAAADDDQITKIQAQIESLTAIAATAAEALGEDDPKTLDYQEQLADAQNLLRLARVNQAVQSMYEPLTAKLSYGFVGQNLGNGVVTGLIAWISTKPWDDLAVGQRLDPNANNPDPQRPLSGPIDGIEGDKLAHPFASPYTLMVAEAPLGELTQESVGIPWQPSALTIPESYFRSSMGATLAASLDAKWQEGRETEDLQHEQDGTTPDYQVNVGQMFAVVATGSVPGLESSDNLLSGKPTTPGLYKINVGGQEKTLWVREAALSRTWDGRWYFHVAAWWSAVYSAVPNSPS